MRRSPLLALAGAPKCGTTALARSLSGHPQVTFSVPKEPFWFGSDLVPLREREGLRPDRGYDQVFRSSRSPDERWRAEGSTLYLSSPDALAQLDVAEPGAHLLCSLRDPVEVVRSFHTQMVFAAMEPLSDPAAAWEAQNARSLRPEPACPVPRLLQYRQIAALGDQLAAALDRFGPDRVHVVVHDDLVADPEATLRRIASELDLGGPDLAPPPRINEAATLRSPLVARAVRSRPGRILARRARSVLPRGAADGLARAQSSVLRRPVGSTEMPPELRAEVARTLAPQTRLLEEILGRRLPGWTREA